jgi:hypothetical protein
VSTVDRYVLPTAVPETRADILGNLTDLAHQLGTKHRELAFVRVEELRSRVNAWLSSPETSVSGREHDMTCNAVDYTAHVFEVQGEIAELTEYRDHLRLLLAHLDE